jgi:hypothetical protein
VGVDQTGNQEASGKVDGLDRIARRSYGGDETVRYRNIRFHNGTGEDVHYPSACQQQIGCLVAPRHRE